MAEQGTTVLQVRVDDALKRAFADVAERERAKEADMLRRLMRAFVDDSRRNEARRQSARVSEAPDAEETLDVLMQVQDFERD